MRYLEEFADKRSIADDKDHLRKLDPYLRGKRLDQINMDVLWPFIRDRRARDKVANATIDPRLRDRASSVECRAPGLGLAATGAESANALGAEAPDSVSDARGGRPLGGERAGASARSGALCIGERVPDVRDLALGMAARGLRSTRGLVGSWDDKEW
jgi:hypothetical protein